MRSIFEQRATFELENSAKSYRLPSKRRRGTTNKARNNKRQQPSVNKELCMYFKKSYSATDDQNKRATDDHN
jgi:hypothetical protein